MLTEIEARRKAADLRALMMGTGPEEVRCPGCGCQLEPYEIFACRLRGLKKPVCIGCLASALVYLRDYGHPMLEGSLEKIGELADQVPLRDIV